MEEFIFGNPLQDSIPFPFGMLTNIKDENLKTNSYQECLLMYFFFLITLKIYQLWNQINKLYGCILVFFNSENKFIFKILLVAQNLIIAYNTDIVKKNVVKTTKQRLIFNMKEKENWSLPVVVPQFIKTQSRNKIVMYIPTEKIEENLIHC